MHSEAGRASVLTSVAGRRRRGPPALPGPPHRVGTEIPARRKHLRLTRREAAVRAPRGPVSSQPRLVPGRPAHRWPCPHGWTDSPRAPAATHGTGPQTGAGCGGARGRAPAPPGDAHAGPRPRSAVAGQGDSGRPEESPGRKASPCPAGLVALATSHLRWDQSAQAAVPGARPAAAPTCGHSGSPRTLEVAGALRTHAGTGGRAFSPACEAPPPCPGPCPRPSPAMTPHSPSLSQGVP